MKTILKIIIILLWIIIANVALFSQVPVIKFTYDASGNRTNRVITYEKKSLPPGNKLIYKDSLAEHDITIYPNPTKGLISIKITNMSKASSSSILLHDFFGKTIIKLEKLTEDNKVDLSNLPNASYFMKITIDDKTTEWKIIKQE